LSLLCQDVYVRLPGQCIDVHIRPTGLKGLKFIAAAVVKPGRALAVKWMGSVVHKRHCLIGTTWCKVDLPSQS